MKYKPSTFYSNFSVVELIKRNQSRLGIACSSAVMGGGGGGSGFQNTLSNEARYHKSESFHCSHGADKQDEFEESGLPQSLKEEIEKEISQSNARVVESGPLPSGFYVEYCADGIQGRVELTCNFSGRGSIGFNATLTETSTTEKQPLVGKRNQEPQPVGDYHVVRFPPDDPRASTDDFYETGQKAIKESVASIQHRLVTDYSKKDVVLRNLEYAVVFCWSPITSDLKEKWAELTGQAFEVPSEYDHQGRVYFLNEVALRMYREVGEDFAVWTIISADEVAKIPGPSLRGPYLSQGPDLLQLSAQPLRPLK
jgi:hypothetical protein